MNPTAKAVEQAMVPAFEIADAHGADLLVALGRFGAWHGDLAAMRGDHEGAGEHAGDDAEPAHDGDAETALLVAQALQALQPRCRETLELRYVKLFDAAAIARELDTTSKYAESLVRDCFRRLIQAIDNIPAAAVFSSVPIVLETAAPAADVICDGKRAGAVDDPRRQ